MAGKVLNTSIICADGFGQDFDLTVEYMIKKYRQDPKKVDEIKGYIYDSIILFRKYSKTFDFSKVMLNFYGVKHEKTQFTHFFTINGERLRTQYKIYFRPLDVGKFQEIMDSLIIDKKIRSAITSVVTPSDNDNKNDRAKYRRDSVVIGFNFSESGVVPHPVLARIASLTKNRVVAEAPIIGHTIAPGVFLLPSSRMDTINDPLMGIAKRIYATINSKIEANSCVNNRDLIKMIRNIMEKDYLNASFCGSSSNDQSAVNRTIDDHL